jgi:hypothetical protein
MKVKRGELLEFPSRKQIDIDKELAALLEHLSERKGYTDTEVTPAIRDLAEMMVEIEYEFRKDKRAEDLRLGSKWEKPELVAKEKAFMDAAEFFGRLHPDTRAIALALLQQQ